MAAALSVEPDLALRTADRSCSVFLRSRSICDATSLYDSDICWLDLSSSFISSRCSFHLLMSGFIAAARSPKAAMIHPTGPIPVLMALNISLNAEAAALMFPASRFLAAEAAMVETVAPLRSLTSSARDALFLADQKFCSLLAATSASFAAVSAMITPRYFMDMVTRPPMTFNPRSARSITSFTTGISCWPISTTSSWMAFFCFSRVAVADSFFVSNSSKSDVPARKLSFARSCCCLSSSVFFDSVPSLCTALWPFRCISSIAATTEWSVPSAPFIPSRTRMRASFTSLLRRSVNSCTDIFAISANVSVLLNIAVMVCPTAVPAVSTCWPYLSRVAAIPRIEVIEISAFGATPASRLVKSTMYPSLAVDAIPSELMAEPVRIIEPSRPYCSFS